MNLKLAQRLVALLPDSAPGLFNPWKDTCPFDEPWNGPRAKLERLAQHLDCDAKWILCGEAPGYLGCRHSGVAFTSERLVMNGCIPRLTPTHKRMTRAVRPLAEPSATVVWKVLYALQVAETTILWNALQMHPHPQGRPRSNRTPTGQELAAGRASLHALIDHLPDAGIIAVGKKAEGALQVMGIPVVAAVRHPANGGAGRFASEMKQALSSAAGVSL